MKLQLVSFEQAKALKKVGFPQGWRCEEKYYCLESDGEYGYKMGNIISANAAHKSDLNVISAPTLELVAKWLRDEKNIHICPEYRTLKDVFYYTKINGHVIEDDFLVRKVFKTHEEALSAGIDKAIEILNGN